MMRASSLGKFKVAFTEEVLAIVKVEPMPPLEGQTFYLTETAEYVTPAKLLWIPFCVGRPFDT